MEKKKMIPSKEGHTGRPRFLAKKSFTKIHQHLTIPIKIVTPMENVLKYSENII